MTPARVRRHRVTASPEVDLQVMELGPPGAEALVVAHGVGSSARFVLETFGAPVIASGRRLVAYDLRGHGDSTPVREPAGHAFERHLEDLHAVVGASGARLVGGVSLGGHVAAGYAARGGAVQGVVACLPAWTGRAVPGEGPHAAVAAEVATLGIAELVERFERDDAMVPWLRNVLIRDWAASDPDSLRAALVALDGALAPSDVELSDLQAPLGVVGWADDPGHPLEVARSWAGRAPRGVLVETSLTAMEEDGTALGAAAVAALELALA